MPIIGVFNCGSAFGKLKVVATLVSGFAVGRLLGTMAAVVMGVVLMLVVVVEELRVAQLFEQVTGAIALTSSA